MIIQQLIREARAHLKAAGGDVEFAGARMATAVAAAPVAKRPRPGLGSSPASPGTPGAIPSADHVADVSGLLDDDDLDALEVSLVLKDTAMLAALVDSYNTKSEARALGAISAGITDADMRQHLMDINEMADYATDRRAVFVATLDTMDDERRRQVVNAYNERIKEIGYTKNMFLVSAFLG